MLNMLHVSSSGLVAAQEQVDNVMNNIANENTPGYKKRVVNISEAEHSDARQTGRGVTVGDTTRVTNIYVYDNLTDEKSKQSQFSELSTMLANIEGIFSETDDSGFSADLDRYFQSLENLRANPSNEIYQNNLKTTGQIIVDDLQTLYSNIERQEKISLNTVYDDVDTVNSYLKDIGDVNYQLSNKVSNDLLDKRDQLEQKLATYTDITIDRSNNYELKLSDLTAVRFETNIHTVEAKEEYQAQKNFYANDDRTSNLVDSSTWADVGDKVTYRFDNKYNVSVAYGEVIKDSSGNNVDLNGDGDDTNDAVTKDNVVNAMVYKINNNTDINTKIEAFNGDYVLDKDGNKILTNDPRHPDYDPNDPNKDRYLIIESKTPGEEGKFVGTLITEDANNTTPIKEIKENNILSKKATDDVHLEIFDKELTLKSGSMKPMLDNLTTESDNNYFSSYKTMLDNFANALSDMSASYISNSDGSYVYGQKNVDLSSNKDKRVDINLFSGSTVNSLEFNSSKVSTLSQDDLDYLSTLQWKEDIDMDGTGENLTSFSKYYQRTRVKVSNDKENVDFKKDAQDSVTQSLQTTYDKLTKVDKDQELINLVKYQAAYQANAKLLTTLDEMINTILNIKR
jgi:flagellar hook-associated protein 1 FlgK